MNTRATSALAKLIERHSYARTLKSFVETPASKVESDLLAFKNCGPHTAAQVLQYHREIQNRFYL